MAFCLFLVRRYLDRYEKTHFLGDDGGRGSDEDEDSRHKRWSARALHSVPLTYNHSQHVISGKFVNTATAPTWPPCCTRPAHPPSQHSAQRWLGGESIPRLPPREQERASVRDAIRLCQSPPLPHLDPAGLGPGQASRLRPKTHERGDARSDRVRPGQTGRAVNCVARV